MTLVSRISTLLACAALLLPQAHAKMDKASLTKKAEEEVAKRIGPNSAEMGELLGISLPAAKKESKGSNSTSGQNPDAKRTAALLKKLKLQDKDKEAQVQAAAEEFYGKMRMWHTEHDAELNELWKQFNDAGNKKDIPGREKVTEKVMAVYTSLQPDHDAFVSKLSATLSPEQVEAAKDAMTVGKVPFTFNAYHQMIPEMTDKQKDHIMGEMKAAREEGMNTSAGKELNNFFEIHKTRCEQYIDTEGYGYHKRYKMWTDKLKADKAAKTAAAAPKAS